ncbi:Shedu immune nuclease family protein [Neobacillus cucumis]|uniref:Shedu immune nuclease family protein n=1 Tax=Neobacillus cucumis TaxID=1740721 RepID=UPI002E1E388B|nr:DUF4263 domain-containing protein [Neobacillus cucumis]
MELYDIKPFFFDQRFQGIKELEEFDQHKAAKMDIQGNTYKGGQSSPETPFYFTNDNNIFILDDILKAKPSEIPENVVLSISSDIHVLPDTLSNPDYKKVKAFIEEKIIWPFNTFHFGNFKGSYFVAFNINGIPIDNGKAYSIEAYRKMVKKIHPQDTLNESFLVFFKLDDYEKDLCIDSLFSEYSENLKELHKKVESFLGGLEGFLYVLEKWEKRTEEESKSEPHWQKLFEDFPWIISTCLSIPAMHFNNKAYVGGKAIDDKGGKVPDFIYHSPIISNLAIIEIKKPSSQLVSNVCYRIPDVFGISMELSGALNQLLAYRESLQSEFLVIKTNTSRLLGKDINLLNPKCILIVGSIDEFKENGEISIENNLKLECFERFRNELRSIEIITFDELFEKIRLFLNISTDFVEPKST